MSDSDRPAPLRQLSWFAQSNDAAVSTLVRDPPELEGWREEIGRALPQIKDGRCTEVRRPCPWVSCPNHLLLDLTRPKDTKVREPSIVLNEGPEGTARLGRKPALQAHDSEEDAARFIASALAELDRGRASCAIDIATSEDRSGRVLTHREVGDFLGVTEETARIDEISALHKLKALALAGGFRADEHDDPRDAVAAMLEAVKRGAGKAGAPLVRVRRSDGR